MRRTRVPPPAWTRYLRPPAPPPRDVKIVTWSFAIVGVVFFGVSWSALSWRDNQALAGRRATSTSDSTVVLRDTASTDSGANASNRAEIASSIVDGGVTAADGRTGR